MGCAGVGMPLVHLELVGRGGLGRRLLDRLRELEVVVVDPLQEDENIASLDQSRAGEGFRIIASKRSSKDDIYRAMFLEDDD